MKIYFSASIRAGRSDQRIYSDLINILKLHGTVLTEHIGQDCLSDQGENLPDDFIYTRDMGWLYESDAVVAEVSTPSLGVGFEIAHAVIEKKPTLCLYRPTPGKKLSGMISGCPNILKKYYKDVDEANNIIREFFASP